MQPGSHRRPSTSSTAFPARLGGCCARRGCRGRAPPSALSDSRARAVADRHHRDDGRRRRESRRARSETSAACSGSAPRSRCEAIADLSEAGGHCPLPARTRARARARAATGPACTASRARIAEHHAFAFLNPCQHFDLELVRLAELDVRRVSMPRRASHVSDVVSLLLEDGIDRHNSTSRRLPTTMSARTVISGLKSALVGSSSTVRSNRLSSGGR